MVGICLSITIWNVFHKIGNIFQHQLFWTALYKIINKNT